MERYLVLFCFLNQLTCNKLRPLFICQAKYRIDDILSNDSIMFIMICRIFYLVLLIVHFLYICCVQFFTFFKVFHQPLVTFSWLAFYYIEYLTSYSVIVGICALLTSTESHFCRTFSSWFNCVLMCFSKCSLHKCNTSCFFVFRLPWDIS